MKIKFKGTPAPWHAIEFAGWWHLHSEPFYTSTDLLDEDKCLSAKHNAQLAATAPDLLDALTRLIEAAKPHCVAKSQLSMRVKEAEEIINKALTQLKTI